MKKIVATSLVLACSSTLAGNLSITYESAKLAQCSVLVEYFDGDKNRVTCAVEDKGIFRTAGSTVTLNCQGADEIKHLNDDASAVLILSNCKDTIKALQAKESYGAGTSKGADSFWARGNDKSGIKNKVITETAIDGCYNHVSIVASKVRVLITRAITLDSRCKSTTLI
ncbi:hypothetical protein [Colwellia psychrerythraea]|uniref:Lipoprotein n=1 Tax=Colwellia psychrerythraea TaxID=28229 RepID=A0A099L6C3_COLPS|nr:hypothetical protein [Colwellia psychrerythraea]KGJ97438.1 hypothetical protein GAB14E_1027 [Colwellia psychrerythraea]